MIEWEKNKLYLEEEMENAFYENSEKELDGIEFYQSHPFLKPFIRKRYSDNELGMKILLVGESHYINEPFPEITYDNLLSDWWGENPPLINKYNDEVDDRKWYNTRNVIKSFMSDNKGDGYGIYREPCKIYNECVLNSKYQEKQEIKKIYDSFAFMNYFQMPALYNGMSLEGSLIEFNNETPKNRPLTDEMWNKIKDKSKEIFLSVVEILKPDKIIFLSTKAYETFGNCDEKKIFHTVHPTCAWWNRKMKFDNLSGRERLVQIFNNFVAERS